VVQHAVRANVLGEEQTWTLANDKLEAISANKRDIYALSAVACLRLEWTPSRFETRMYKCHISLRTGEVLTINSSHFRGLADFEDRSETYRPFVQSLATSVLQCNPSCAFWGGASGSLYLLNVVAIAASIIAVSLILLLIEVDWYGLLVASAAIALFAVPLLSKWFSVNKPRKMTLQEAVASHVLETYLPLSQP
jgi:hypothetical protein